MSNKSPPEDKSKDELWDMYLREVAGRDNDQKRHVEDVKRVREQSVTAAIRDVLPAVDELDRATEAASRESGRGGLGRIKEGLGHTRRSVQRTLESIGVESFDSVGEDFDPQRMEAITRIPDPNLEPGKVAGELERGYTHKGKLLRASRVAVAVEPEEDIAS